MRRTNKLLGAVLVSAWLTLPALSFAQVAKKVAQASFPSVVLLVMEDGSGQPLSLASGFFLTRDTVATNAHVIQGASRGYARRIGDKVKYDVRSILAIDQARDLVILQLDKGVGAPLKLGDSDALGIGDDIFAVGNPQGLEGTFSQGIVSGIREVSGTAILQITAPISPGSSGGPILNAQAEVVGIAVATFRGGQNLNFAVPVKYLAALMTTAPRPRSLASHVKEASDKPLLSELGGGKSTDGVVGMHFDWDASPISGRFSFSLVNKLREPVRKVYCLVIFYRSEYRPGAFPEPLHAEPIYLPETIPSGLARRVTARVDKSVEQLNAPRYGLGSPSPPSGKVEFRVLRFEVVREQ
jgi:hypothetical protein